MAVLLSKACVDGSIHALFAPEAKRVLLIF